jgi:hypothetical protein
MREYLMFIFWIAIKGGGILVGRGRGYPPPLQDWKPETYSPISDGNNTALPFLPF